MSRTDLIADALTVIRNALMTRKKNVDVPYSKIIESILKILKEKKYINDYKLIEYATGRKSASKQKSFKVYLRYLGEDPAITNLKRISKPSLKVYVNKGNIPRVLRGHGTVILSTSKGILSGDQAKEEQTGGEVICSVW